MTPKQIYTLLGLIIVALVGAIAVLLTRNDIDDNAYVINSPSGNERVTENATVKEPNEVEAVTTTTAPAVEEKWRSYVNTKFGYSLSLPMSYDLPDPQTDEAIFTSDTGRIGVIVKESYIYDGTGKRTPVAFKDYYFMDFGRSGEGKLGGKTAAIFTAPRGYCDGPGCSEPFIAYATDKPVALFYNLVFSGDTKLSSVEEQILASFKFKYAD